MARFRRAHYYHVMHLLKQYPVIVAIMGQLVFSIADILGRANLRGKPFALETMEGKWLVPWLACHFFGMAVQVYLFTTVPLGRAIGLMALVSLVLSNLFGYMLLKEVLTPVQYLGLGFGVMALVCLSWN